ncbi:sulfurtransferase [Thiomonas intermedia]|uniref:sulfurtransferase n=1 Tax=Thiomonas intermedia TaxID=926 RepID=UPI0009A51697|nr:rhodanese-like domain-containing protein [Thiomonas intermedia]
MKIAKTLIAAAIGMGAAHAAFAMNVPGPLVTPQWLKAHQSEVTIVTIGDNPAKMFTAQPQMGKNNAVMKVGGHVPGSILVDFGDIRQARVEDGVKLKALMPTAEFFTSAMDKAGMNSGKPIVIVPEGEGLAPMDMGTRLYFQLRYFGEAADQVAILNGGTAAWLNAGYKVSTDAAPTAMGNWKAGAEDHAILASIDEVKAGLKGGSEQFIDARPTPQYLGIAKKPIDKSAGHLPGAKSFPTDAIVQSKDGVTRFMTAADYKHIFGAYNIMDSAPTTTYCNTGHLASGAWFVVHEIVGNKNSKLYANSMNEWTNLGNPTVGLPG